MAQDVSKLTILVLLVLTILVSILGTWTVMSSLTAPVPDQTKQPTPSGNGMVSIDIVRPEAELSEVTGHVSIDIVGGG